MDEVIFRFPRNEEALLTIDENEMAPIELPLSCKTFGCYCRLDTMYVGSRSIEGVNMLAILFGTLLLLPTKDDASWSIIYQTASGAKAIRLADGTTHDVKESIPMIGLAEFVNGRLTYSSGMKRSVVSPNGKRVAHVLMTILAAQHGVIAVTDLDGKNLIKLSEPAIWSDHPAWLSNDRLLFERVGAIGKGGQKEIVLADLQTSKQHPFFDQSLDLSSGIEVLSDGRFLGVRRTNKARELVVIDPTQKHKTEVVLNKVDDIEQLGAMPDNTTVWIRSRKALQLIDREKREVVHRWEMSSIIKPEWNALVMKCLPRPDGQAFAISMYPFMSEMGKVYPCQKMLIVVDAIALPRAESVKVITLEPGFQLLRWEQDENVKKPVLMQDKDIRQLAHFDLEKELQEKNDLLNIRILKVVPAGETKPLEDVFKALKLEDANLGKPRQSTMNHVTFLRWQVSPSYDLVCMTSSLNQPEGDVPSGKRSVYGVRLVMHTMQF